MKTFLYELTKSAYEVIVGIAAVIAILAIYGLVGADDYKAQEESAAYTAEIMAQWKEASLRDRELNRLNAWGDQYVPQRVAMGGNDE